jgi:DNA polymerase elongation subunit (family B)
MSEPKRIGKSFRLLDFHTYDNKTDEDSASDSSGGVKTARSPPFYIQMFGLNEKGETASITITDYNPFFYVKVGDKWSHVTAQSFLADIKTKVGKSVAASVLSAELVDHNKLYGFAAGKKSRFVKITFMNLTAFNRTKNLWYQYDQETNRRNSKPYIYNKLQLELYESNIPPLLRFFHIQQISPSGWVFVQTKKMTAPQIKTTTCHYEYIGSLKHISPLNEKETPVPYKICSFDIEASSSHGDFPLPKKTYKRFATQLVDVFQLQSQQLASSTDVKKRFMTKAIAAAFGCNKCSDIDLVYTVGEPLTKPDVNARIAALLETPVPHDAPSEDTIETLFEKMNQQAAVGAAAGATEEDDEREPESDDEADDDDEPETEEAKPNAKTKAKPKPKAQEIYLYDYLLKADVTREEKISKTNALMVHHFPKVEGDKVTFIGSTFLTYGSKETFNHCLVLDTCDPVEGVVIESKATEREVLLGWTDLIQRENPDIIIGYNIFGFDYEFMFQRAKENGCEESFLRLARRRAEIGGKRVGDEWVLDKTQIKIASGEYDLRYPMMMGRLQIDLYAYFRRDFNLSSYKLDDVAGQYISDEIKFSEITADGNTNIYSKNLAGLHAGDFIHVKINSFSSDYYKDGQKLRVLAIEQGVQYKETGKTYNVITVAGEHQIPEPSGSVVSIDWGMAKDDVSPQDIFRLTKGSSADRAIVAKYCIQDCNLVHHLMGKLDVMTGYTEMSSICSVPISFLVFRGQGVKLTSYVAKKCREKDTLMPDLEKTGGNEGYEGAIVLPPKCSMYIDNPVACVDYSSLYPSAMISQNYSHDSKVWTKEYDMDGNLKRTTGERDSSGIYLYDNLPGYHYINIEFKTFRYLRAHPAAIAKKIQTGTKVCRWAQLPKSQKSIMPSILTELLDARAATRKKAKTEPDPFMQNILDKRQLGYKVTANSLYGQCGAKTSTFYDMDVAASTTATGQMMITYAKRMIEEVYGDSVYETAQHGTVKCNAEYVYGDSVANYTPVLIRANRGISEILTIEQIATKYGGDRWEKGKEGKEFCELPEMQSWTEQGWTRLYRVIRHRLPPGKKMFRIATPAGLVDVTDDHSLLSPNGQEISPNDCEVGTPLLHVPPPDLDLVLYKQFQLPEDSEHFSTDMTYLAKLAYVAQQQGLHIQLENMGHCIALKMSKTRPEGNHTLVVTKESIEYTGNYVYDLTTENHHFAAGVGNMIVHNTDSVFFTFNLTNPETGEKIRGKPALEMTIEIAQEAAQLCTAYLKPPMGLAYEKTLMPFILLSKKRYVGMLYEDDPNDGYLKFMGLVLKRRDNCDLVKDVYGGILHHLMRSDIPSAIQFLYDSLEQLIGGKVPMDKLAITKALRGDYKNPAAIAHRVLADRIGIRDPGNKPKAGDRMKYVYVVKKGAKLQGEKIETPDYILANRLPIDYTHYITNQLMKPLQQLFGLAVEQIWELEKKPAEIAKYRRDMDGLKRETGEDLELFMKKREKYTSAKIKALLFDKFLAKVFNAQNGVRTMDAFYSKR